MKRYLLTLFVFFCSIIHGGSPPSEFQFNNSLSNSVFNFDSVTIDGAQIGTDDWIGAFFHGHCVGASLWGESAALTVMGADGSAGTLDYPRDNDRLIFKIYDTGQDRSYVVLTRQVFRFSQSRLSTVSNLNADTDRQGEIWGFKYFDQNNDGSHQFFEPYLEGWTFTTQSPLGTILETAVSDVNGEFYFNQTPPDPVYVCEELQPGWVQTQPGPPDYCVLVSSTFWGWPADFGNWDGIYPIQGYKWSDINSNGLWDPTEPPVAGVQIDLTEPGTRNVLATTFTDLEGFYYFTTVPQDPNDCSAAFDPGYSHDMYDLCYLQVIAQDAWCCDTSWDWVCEDEYYTCTQGRESSENGDYSNNSHDPTGTNNTNSREERVYDFIEIHETLPPNNVQTFPPAGYHTWTADNIGQDLNFGNHDTSNDCESNPDCDDGDPCTEDVCTGGICVYTPVDCDDQDGCTNDSCVGGNCSHEPVNCDDGLFCNGTETCANGSCQSGQPPCDQTLVCDEDYDECLPCFMDIDCDDGLYCNGSETCFNFACVPGEPPCVPPEVCSEELDACQGCFNVSDCDDGDPCTGESCVSGECQYSPVVCDNNIFCDGVEVCGENGCESGAPPCTPDQICIEATQSCVMCVNDADCDDGDPCTGDICSDGICSSAPIACDDIYFCNGVETCVNGDCVSGTDPCPNQVCNEATDECVECLSVEDCDDGEPCTIDSCDGAGNCVHTPKDCDDNEPCTTDSCNGFGDCVNTPVDCDDDDPCTVDSCDGQGNCVHVPMNCDDEDSCTIDSCSLGICIHQSLDCDDGDPCTVDSCDGAGNCVHEPMNCDDGDNCTIDSCSEGICIHQPLDCDDGDPCTNDGCTNGECEHTDVICFDADPCTVDYCNPGTGDCINEPIDCDDGDPCTNDGCTNGECEHTDVICNDADPCTVDYCNLDTGDCINEPIDCGDGLFCNGVETCVDGDCIPGTDPCPNLVCNEATDDCSSCQFDDDCDDGLFCNGVETCANGGCISGTDPCPNTECDESFGACMCELDEDCDDGDTCTVDSCDSFGACFNTHVDCDDGDPCTVDSCDGAGGCVHEPMNCDDEDNCTTDSCNGFGDCVNTQVDCDDDDPCTVDSCDGQGNCVHVPMNCDDEDSCTVDSCSEGICIHQPLDCDDGDPCTVDSCDEFGACVNTPLDCDDGQFCNGVETCVDGDCIPGTDPCPNTECTELYGACLCELDEDCDDGLYCNGVEICVEGLCGSGDPPCPNLECTELYGACLCELDEDCDDGLYCNGVEICVEGLCGSGDPPCQLGQDCLEENDECISSQLPGDATGDGVIDIADIVQLVADILTLADYYPEADANEDGFLDINDIVLLVCWILQCDLSGRADRVTEALLFTDGSCLSLETDTGVAGLQLEVESGLVITRSHLPSGWELHQSATTLLIFSTDGSSLTGRNELFDFLGTLQIRDSQVADWNGNSIAPTYEEIPRGFMLSDPHPNPFNPVTTIEYVLKDPADVRITVFNTMGQKVVQLVNESQAAGAYSVNWNADKQTSGIYFVKLTAGYYTEKKKILLLK